MFTGSWKTTSAGIIAVIGAIATAYWAVQSGTFTMEVLMAAVAQLLTGIGLIFARDNNVTSEQANAGKQ